MQISGITNNYSQQNFGKYRRAKENNGLTTLIYNDDECVACREKRPDDSIVGFKVYADGTRINYLVNDTGFHNRNGMIFRIQGKNKPPIMSFYPMPQGTAVFVNRPLVNFLIKRFEHIKPPMGSKEAVQFLKDEDKNMY